MIITEVTQEHHIWSFRLVLAGRSPDGLVRNQKYYQNWKILDSFHSPD